MRNITFSKHLVPVGYFCFFLAVQILSTSFFLVLFRLLGLGTADAFGQNIQAVIAGILLQSIITLVVFYRMRWFVPDMSFLRQRRPSLLFWLVALAVGSVIPLQYLYEQLQLSLPDCLDSLFKSLLQHPGGYFLIAVLIPLVEEVVFRGGILRYWLNHSLKNKKGTAVILSALLFAVAHFNGPQSLHAFIIGLLLGWLYYRTRSILPGMAYHLANNTVACIINKIAPQDAPDHLIDLFGGDRQRLFLAIGCSLLILVGAGIQVFRKTCRNEGQCQV